jgi:hypothetical protein
LFQIFKKVFKGKFFLPEVIDRASRLVVVDDKAVDFTQWPWLWLFPAEPKAINGWLKRLGQGTLAEGKAKYNTPNCTK